MRLPASTSTRAVAPTEDGKKLGRCIEEPLYEEQLLRVCSPALLVARGRPRGPADLGDWPLLYDLGWDADWSYWFARQGLPTPDLSRASGFHLYSILVQAAVHGIGAGRCCMKTLCGWGGLARASRDPPQESEASPSSGQFKRRLADR